MSFFWNKIFNKEHFPDGLVADLKIYNHNRNKEDRTSFCHAPFKSLYFGNDGNVSPCCYNRRYVMGNILQQNIENIWQGKKAEIFRKALKKNDLSLGCYICEQEFKGGNYDAVSALMYDGLPAKNKYPFLLEFETDTACNLECIMCTGEYSSAIRMNRENKEPAKDIYGDNFIAQLRPYLKNLKDAKFNGGEPFLSKYYQKIWSEILLVNPSCSISVQTNGTILNDQIKDFLKRGNFHISVSLDALEKDLYEKIRVNAKYEKLIENLTFFRDYCHERGHYFGLAVCPMRLNWKEMPALLSFANKNGAKIHFHTVWFPPSLALWNLSCNELSDIYNYLESFKWITQSDIEMTNIKTYQFFIAQIKQWRFMAKQYEKENLENIDIINLKSLLVEKINKWCDANITEKAENSLKKAEFKNTIEEIIDKFDKIGIEKCIKEILKTPVEFIVLTLETNDKVKIMERFKAFVF